MSLHLFWFSCKLAQLHTDCSKAKYANYISASSVMADARAINEVRILSKAKHAIEMSVCSVMVDARAITEARILSKAKHAIAALIGCCNLCL